MSDPRASSLFRTRRRRALVEHDTQMGLDWVSVKGSGYTLQLHFVPKDEADKASVPKDLTPGKVRIFTIDGADVLRVGVKQIIDPQSCDGGGLPANTIEIDLEQNVQLTGGQESSRSWRLQLEGVEDLDPFFSEAAVVFEADGATGVDERPPPPIKTPRGKSPNINYLARDYDSFRQLMLDRMANQIPSWQARGAGDLGVTLVEVLAYASDLVSYHQDAVATEAYLGTARRRISLRRHAQMLDYTLQEGNNARVWVQLALGSRQADQAPRVQTFVVPAGTRLLTRIAGYPTQIPARDLEEALVRSPQVFETLFEKTLHADLDDIALYTWGASELVLAEGATSTTLVGKLSHLKSGDVLVLEALPGQEDAGAPDMTRRHALRLTEVTYTGDPLGEKLMSADEKAILAVGDDGLELTQVRWAETDALPFDLVVAAGSNQSVIGNRTRAQGNIVLADHGRTIREEPLIPPVAPPSGPYRPRLDRGGMTFRAASTIDALQGLAAVEALIQDPGSVMPALVVSSNEGVWQPRRNLLSSDRFAQDFVVEMESDGRAWLRFGNGTLGARPRPGTGFVAQYRVGNGRDGNIGAEALAHVVDDRTEADASIIVAVRNPLPAMGGVDAEPLERIRVSAPHAPTRTQRCVTPEDYARAAEEHHEVQRAAATMKWTGSGRTVYLALDRIGGRTVDDAFRGVMLDFLEPRRLIGHDIEVVSPRFVPVFVKLKVSVKRGHVPITVAQTLRRVIGDSELSDGGRGLFHPDRQTFGQPVYLSSIEAAAAGVPGVSWVEPLAFQRLEQPAAHELEDGVLRVGPLEIPRLDDNPMAPANGRLELQLVEAG